MSTTLTIGTREVIKMAERHDNVYAAIMQANKACNALLRCRRLLSKDFLYGNPADVFEKKEEAKAKHSRLVNKAIATMRYLSTVVKSQYKAETGFEGFAFGLITDEESVLQEYEKLMCIVHGIVAMQYINS